MILVIAGNREEFNEFVEKHEDPFKRKVRIAAGIATKMVYRYCWRPRDIMRFEPGEHPIVYTGTFDKNPLYATNELRRIDPNMPPIPFKAFLKGIFKEVGGLDNSGFGEWLGKIVDVEEAGQ